MQKTIKLFFISEVAIFALWLYSYAFFINFQVAFLSSVLILLGSTYSYKRLVDRRVASEDRPDDTDLIDKIDDPFDLYSEEIGSEAMEVEEVDLKTVVKEEKKRLKENKQTVKNTAKSAPALVSIFRVVPYLFLVLGFIGLNNNGLLSLVPFLVGLGFGVVAGLFMGRSLFIKEQ
ncbi:MAG: hypothetical protein ABFR02_07715 [Campylobacterota bacterium]